MTNYELPEPESRHIRVVVALETETESEDVDRRPDDGFSAAFEGFLSFRPAGKERHKQVDRDDLHGQVLKIVVQAQHDIPDRPDVHSSRDFTAVDRYTLGQNPICPDTQGAAKDAHDVLNVARNRIPVDLNYDLHAVAGAGLRTQRMDDGENRAPCSWWELDLPTGFGRTANSLRTPHPQDRDPFASAHHNEHR